MFPSMLMPLHIFEPRYKELLQRAINDDGMITMALIRPEQKREDNDHETIFNVAAVGEVIHYAKAEDETYNIVLEGSHRVNLKSERHESMVRVFEGDVIEDECPDEDVSESEELCEVISDRVKTWVAKKLPTSVHDTVLDRINDASSCANKLDRMASFAIHSIANRQVLLQTPNVLKRARMIENLTRWAGTKDYYHYINQN